MKGCDECIGICSPPCPNYRFVEPVTLIKTTGTNVELARKVIKRSKAILKKAFEVKPRRMLKKDLEAIRGTSRTHTVTALLEHIAYLEERLKRKKKC